MMDGSVVQGARGRERELRLREGGGIATDARLELDARERLQ
jgi:hypothetical protein